MGTRCAVQDAVGYPCGEPADPASGLNLCAHHLLAAYDWVSRDVGVTDALPSPCLACGSRLGVWYPSGWLCAICEWRVGEIPDAAAPDIRVDVVYYVRYRDSIKIGTSGNPRSRLGQLMFDDLLAFERGGRPTEQKRHRQFAELRLGTSEWFAAGDALLRHVAILRVGDDDPWDQYRRWLSERAAASAVVG